MAWLADDILEVLASEPPKNIRIVVCGPRTALADDDLHAAYIDIFNGNIGIKGSVANTDYVWHSKKKAREAMAEFLELALQACGDST
jgi:hypothetical protein